MAIVKLKRQNNTLNQKEFKLFILVPSFNNNNTVEYIDRFVDREYPNHIYRYNIWYSGNLDKFPHYKDVVGKFKKRGFEGAAVFRNYYVTEEEQKKRNIYCNVAEDAATSFNTAISVCGSREGAVVELILTNLYDTGDSTPL